MSALSPDYVRNAALALSLLTAISQAVAMAASP